MNNSKNCSSTEAKISRMYLEYKPNMPSLQSQFPHGGGDEDEGRGDRSVDRAAEEGGDDGHIS